MIKHPMITRSKKDNKGGNGGDNNNDDDEIDSNNNLKGFIDTEEDDFDNEMFQKEISKLKQGKINFSVNYYTLVLLSQTNQF